MADNFGDMTITAANSIFYLQVPGLYDAPVRIEQFGTDAMVSVAQNNPVVAEVGVDGHTSTPTSATTGLFCATLTIASVPNCSIRTGAS